jgi:hypothetical protein
MTLGGPAGNQGQGVDAAAVLVGYFGITDIYRDVLAVGGVVFTIIAGCFLGSALGDQQLASPAVLAGSTDVSVARRTVGIAVAVLSVCSIAAGTALLVRRGLANPMAAFLFADILWAVAMLILTPWRRPGPRFVRDTWLVPAIAAMALLTVVGVVFPCDYSVAGLFFLPQVATAAYCARHRQFCEPAHAAKRERLGIAARAV